MYRSYSLTEKTANRTMILRNIFIFAASVNGMYFSRQEGKMSEFVDDNGRRKPQWQNQNPSPLANVTLPHKGSAAALVPSIPLAGMVLAVIL